MEESIFQTFLLLAYFNIALLSVTIANYAVSASYLGRETRLSRRRMERKKQELIEKLGGLRREEPKIDEIKKEIKKSDAERKRLGRRIFLLSWLGAVILPSTFFAASFILATIGVNSEILLDNPEFLQQQMMIFSLGTIGLGFMILLIVIRTIDSAARNIPVPEFKVSFTTGLKKEKFKSKEKKKVTFCFENIGEDVAESATIFVLFPPEFVVHLNPLIRYIVHKQSDLSDTPNYTAAIDTEVEIHPEILLDMPILLTMPEKEDDYTIIIKIHEGKIGIHRDKLVIKIAK